MRDERVIVVGAGVAGLVAARTLRRSGVAADLIEARERVGGRIVTLREPDWPWPIELGPEFVHGRPTATLRLLEEAGLPLQEVDDRHHWAFPAGNGQTAGGRLRALPSYWQRMSALLARADRDGPDESAAAFANRQQLAGEERALFELFVRGFHAAPLDEVSVQSLAEDTGGSDEDAAQYRVGGGGYGRLVDWLHGELGTTAESSGAPRCHVHGGCVVRGVTWRRGQVDIDVAEGAGSRRFSARAALLTVPVGVLAATAEQGGIRFEPELPQQQAALREVGVGHVTKLVLRFREPFWDEHAAPRFAFLHDPSAAFVTFWREQQGPLQQITAWAGAPRPGAAASDEPLVTQALGALCRLLGADADAARAALIGVHHHDFEHDPFARGAYSYARPHGGDAHGRLARPIDGTLFFAGEATDPDYPATVAGAIRSGERAARELLGAWSSTEGRR